VMTLIREDVPYSINESPYQPPQPDHHTYCASTTVHVTKALNLTVVNVYSPPARWTAGQRTQEQGLQPDGIRSDRQTVVCADFNAHCLTWDPYQRESTLGEEIEDWALDAGLCILNDGSHTRLNPSTGGRSAPDVTLLSRGLLGPREVTWATQRGIGSDHLPILIRMSSSIKRQQRRGRSRFNHRKADWTGFRARLDELIATWSDQPLSLTEANRRLVSTILQAARSSIPFGNGRGRRPAFWNDAC